MQERILGARGEAGQQIVQAELYIEAMVEGNFCVYRSLVEPS